MGPGTQKGFPKLCISGVSKIKNKLVVRGGVPVVTVGQPVPVSGPTGGPGTHTGFLKLCTSVVSKIQNKFVFRGGVPVVVVGQAVSVS
jgi:hypothetical protein